MHGYGIPLSGSRVRLDHQPIILSEQLPPAYPSSTRSQSVPNEKPCIDHPCFQFHSPILGEEDRRASSRCHVLSPTHTYAPRTAWSMDIVMKWRALHVRNVCKRQRYLWNALPVKRERTSMKKFFILGRLGVVRRKNFLWRTIFKEYSVLWRTSSRNRNRY